jgi:hypothetical protein
MGGYIMDRNFIIEYLSKKLSYTKDQTELVKAIEEAREQLQYARRYFDIVDEPKLIDHAIYMEDAARTKLTYLLGEAKERGIRVDSSMFLDGIEAM